MTLPTGPAPGNPMKEKDGPMAGLLGLFGSLSQHAQGLIALAGIEAREAVALYLKLAILLAIALGALLFGYVFAVLCAAFLLATLLHVSWIWITLGIAAFHLLVAVAAVLYVKSNFRNPVFQATGEEIRRDIASLRGASES